MIVNSIDPSCKKDLTSYLEVPYTLSRKNSDWFPALRSSVAFDLSPRHPFYEHSEAAFFTCGNPARPSGRIAVMANRNFNDYHNIRHAFFTHFDCVDDPAVAQALFDAAAGWAASRGLCRLTGPVGFLQTDARGLMISGHGMMTSFALPCTLPYYSALMQACGFVKRCDYLSGELKSGFRISKRVEQMAQRMMERSEAALCSGKSRRSLRRLGEHFLEIYKESGSSAPLYYPLTPGEKNCILNRLCKTVHPKLIHWLEKNNRICGVHIALPNYMEALRRAGSGRLARMAAFMRQRAKPREINITTTYLNPESQGRGLNLILYAACQQTALQIGCRRGLVGPVHEKNTATLKVLKKTGVKFNICHRLFEREIT